MDAPSPASIRLGCVPARHELSHGGTHAGTAAERSGALAVAPPERNLAATPSRVAPPKTDAAQSPGVSSARSKASDSEFTQ